MDYKFDKLEKDAREEWLAQYATTAFMKDLQQIADDYREAAVRGSANAQSDLIVRSAAGAYVALDRAIKWAKQT